MTAASGAVTVVTEIAMRSLALLVIIGMTGGTVRGVSRERPGHHLIVAGVAIRTGEIGPMVAWIVATDMRITGHRQPSAGAVAAVALLGGDKVSARHTAGRDAVMAAVTGTQHLGMIDPDHRYPGGVAMAVLA